VDHEGVLVSETLWRSGERNVERPPRSKQVAARGRISGHKVLAVFERPVPTEVNEASRVIRTYYTKDLGVRAATAARGSEEDRGSSRVGEHACAFIIATE
jgi:hypothetical protein